jgi:two-component system, LytTR family, sensor kinase
MERLIPYNWQGWLRLAGLSILLVIGAAYLLQHYGLPMELAVVDAGLHLVLVGISVFVLENIFRFYLPQRKNKWLAFGFPVVLAVIVLFFGTWALGATYSREVEAVLFWGHILWVRGFLLLVILGFISGILIIRAKLEKEENSRRHEAWLENTVKEAELYHLRQQLQPHFLFNSLNSINALLNAQPDRAREMVLQLSDFLRATVRKDHKQWTTVGEEVKFLQQYLDIERIRFGHRLEVEVEVHEEAGNCRLPQLMVQPLIENAVKHGLYGVVDQVIIKLEISGDTTYLQIRVSNPFDEESRNINGQGFGLEGLKRRLFLTFGRHDLLVAEKEEGNFIVTLKIPQQ